MSQFLFFDTCNSTLNRLNESFYQANSTMIVYWSFINFNIIFVAEVLYLIANQKFCLIQTNRSGNSVIFNIHAQKRWNIRSISFVTNTCSAVSEKRSIGAKKYIPLPFSSKIGPPKSVWISWFGSTDSTWGRKCLAGITDLNSYQLLCKVCTPSL